MTDISDATAAGHAVGWLAHAFHVADHYAGSDPARDYLGDREGAERVLASLNELSEDANALALPPTDPERLLLVRGLLDARNLVATAFRAVAHFLKSGGEASRGRAAGAVTAFADHRGELAALLTAAHRLQGRPAPESVAPECPSVPRAVQTSYLDEPWQEDPRHGTVNPFALLAEYVNAVRDALCGDPEHGTSRARLGLCVDWDRAFDDAQRFAPLCGVPLAAVFERVERAALAFHQAIDALLDPNLFGPASLVAASAGIEGVADGHQLEALVGWTADAWQAYQCGAASLAPSPTTFCNGTGPESSSDEPAEVDTAAPGTGVRDGTALRGLDDLLAAADRLNLKKDGRKIVERVCKAGGKLPLADLAIHLGWVLPWVPAWQSAQNRLNKRLRPLGWELSRRDNMAVAVAVCPEVSESARK